MRKLFGFLFVFFLATAAYAQEGQPAAAEQTDGPVITFTEKMHDFGDITQGDKVQHVFTFTNSGNEPLILANVETTCGCTASNWPRDPIAPGEEGQITVTFNSTGKMGIQNKVIRVRSNATNNVETVKIVTNVLPQKDSR